VADRQLLFFGDSHIVGVGDPAGAGWVDRDPRRKWRETVGLIRLCSGPTL
jgi:lysophospholipase L1-like esterase